jgi:D-3-phosphoglycerate dehydrogenase
MRSAPSILVPEPLAGPPLDALGARFPLVSQPDLWRDPAALGRRAAQHDALLVRNQSRVDARVLAAGRAGRLAVVARAGAGLDNVDVAAATAAGIAVTYVPDASTGAVAELALGLMLALARKIVAADRATRAGAWDRDGATGFELEGRVLGLVGCGRIGRRFGRKARALGMRLCGSDPHVAPDDPELRGLELRLGSLDEVLAQSDVVSLHLPLSAETRGLLDETRLRRMKPGALLVNTARGGIVDEAALAAALRSGHLAGAALDVRPEEPPPLASTAPLAALPNVILTPHVGAFSHDAKERVLSVVCADLAALLDGAASRNPANPLAARPLSSHPSTST